MNGRVIRFDAHERLVARARAYVNDAGGSGPRHDAAVGLLHKAFKRGDEDLKLKIVLMLGTLVCPQAVAPLYELMHDADESEFIRHAAAVQLSVLGGLLQDNAQLVARLIDDLRDPDPFSRANATFALGWEGNLAAMEVLIERLDDENPEVQQAAVNALGNLKDERLFGVLAAKLEQGAREQKRTILYNLYRFTARKPEAVAIYERFILRGDRALRCDALAVLHALARPQDHLALYRQCLLDEDHRVRELALIHLAGAPPAELVSLRKRILAMTRDPEAEVRRAAVRLGHHIQPSAVVPAAP